MTRDQLRRVVWAAVFGVVMSRFAGCGTPASVDSTKDRGAIRPRTVQQRLGTVFRPVPSDPFQPPALVRINVPDFPGAYAIWGATGRDDRGHIWFGVSAAGIQQPSARLFEYLPATNTLRDAGDVVTQLKLNQRYRDGEGQMKIHSKLVYADDRYLYFASMDEQGESEDGIQFPTWGGHLWRKRITGDHPWEHLHATKEALIAVAGTGRWIYALGYFRHVVYQYDTQTHRVRSVRIGAPGGHISRNLLVDLNGHVYVPRVVRLPGEPDLRADKDKNVTKRRDQWFRSTLVELDENLAFVQHLPLPYYEPDATFSTHGIIGFTYLNDGAIVFSTHTGFLWKITPRKESAATIEPLGWFHPDGRSYPSALYTFQGQRYVCGVTSVAKRGYYWVVYDLDQGTSRAVDLAAGYKDIFGLKSLLLYGSNTRDEDGSGYLVGRYVEGNRKRPILLKMEFPK